MTHPRFVLASALSALAFVAPAPALAAPVKAPPHSLKLGVTPIAGLESDGTRYEAWNRDGRSVRVYDTLRGRGWDVEVPCDDSHGGAVSVVAGGGGHFILYCNATAPGSWALLDARSRSVEQLGTSQDIYQQIGRHWIRGETTDPTKPPGPPDTLYLNWRSGKRVTVPHANDARAPRDLDSINLDAVHGLPSAENLLIGRYRRTALDTPVAGALNGALVVTGPKGLRRLSAPGALYRQALDVDEHFIGGRAAWVTRDYKRGTATIHSYSLRRPKVRTWLIRHLPNAPNTVDVLKIAQSQKYLVFEVVTATTHNASGDEVGTRYSVYRLRR